MGRGVDRQLVNLNFIVLPGGRDVQPVIAAQLRLDAGHQLQGIEGLGYIVISSGA
ncbi:hypothetical protein D3C71_1990460 [compost metagenome]